MVWILSHEFIILQLLGISANDSTIGGCRQMWLFRSQEDKNDNSSVTYLQILIHILWGEKDALEYTIVNTLYGLGATV